MQSPSEDVVETPAPRLVVTIVIDQLPSWALTKYLEYLPEDGALRRAIARGVWYPQVRYEYASTFTAPGHVAIYTGAVPADSGVMTNKVWDRHTGEERAVVADPKYPTVGSTDKSAAPTELRVPTMGDMLHEVTGGESVILSLSLKDRAAVFSGGKHADLAVWYDHKQKGFVTSTYYADALPEWLSAYREAHPIDELLTAWTAADPELCARATNVADDARGEGEVHGYGRTFPHDPRDTDKPLKRLRLTPQMAEYQIALAAEGARAMSLGEDDVTDLLAISISGTDYVGHTFGADSWEYFDNLVRVDRALARMLDTLEGERGPIAVLITSDHGVQRVPEVHGKGRVYTEDVLKQAQDAAVEALGEGDWVGEFEKPFFFLTADGMTKRDAVVAAVVKELSGSEGIELVVDPREAAGWRDDPDPLRKAIGRSVSADVSGELYLVVAEGWILDDYRERGGGANHGTPWQYDRDVPVLFWGPGIAAARHDEVVSQARVAPTIAKLLGVAPPKGVTAPPL